MCHLKLVLFAFCVPLLTASNDDELPGLLTNPGLLPRILSNQMLSGKPNICWKWKSVCVHESSVKEICNHTCDSSRLVVVFCPPTWLLFLQPICWIVHRWSLVAHRSIRPCCSMPPSAAVTMWSNGLAICPRSKLMVPHRCICDSYCQKIRCCSGFHHSEKSAFRKAKKIGYDTRTS